MTAIVQGLEEQPEAGSEFRRGWPLVVGATLGLALGMPGLLFYSIGIFSHTLAKTFGWSSTVIFSGISFVPIVLLFGGPAIGFMVDRYGTRRIAAASLLLMGLSYASLALTTGSVPQYYLSCFAVAVTGSGATFVTFTRVINRAFTARRGLALGIVVAGSGLFAFFVKPFAGALIAQVGWRATLLAIGLLPIAIGVPAVLVTFPNADSARTAQAFGPRRSAGGLSVGEAVRTRAFWVLLAAFAPAAFATAAPIPHLEDILRSLHATGDMVAVTSLIGVTIILGRLIGGWLMDRMWAPLIGTVTVAGGALGWLMMARGLHGLQAAMASVALIGLAAGIEGSLMSYLTAKYIGVKNYGLIYGILFGVFSFGGGMGPGLIGYIRDRFDSYQGLLYAFAGLLAFSAAALLCLGPYPRTVVASGPD